MKILEYYKGNIMSVLNVISIVFFLLVYEEERIIFFGGGGVGGEGHSNIFPI